MIDPNSIRRLIFAMRPTMRWTLGIFLSLFVTIGVFVLAFFYSEWERKKLLESYQVPASFFDDLGGIGSHQVHQIMRSNEVLVCAIDGYGSTKSLPELSAIQRHSVPKKTLPSEDMTWYLLFFSGEKVERIYLMDTYGELGLDLKNSGCFFGTDKFYIHESPLGQGYNAKMITFRKESNK